MMILNWISAGLNYLRSLVGLILPLFAQAADFRQWGRTVRIVVHIILVIAVLVGLYFLNRYLEVRNAIRADIRLFRQQELFLPAVFLLVYALAWVLRWIWTLLGPEHEDDEFPDITAAWEEGVGKLEAEGIRLTDAPLYLVIGRPAAGDEFLFQAAAANVAIMAPARGDPPIRLWAGRDAIFVTAPDASLLSKLSTLLAHGPDTGDDPIAAPGAVDLNKTLQFDEADDTQREIKQLLAIQKDRELTPEEQHRLRELARPGGSTRIASSRFVVTSETAARQTARLRYLCRLIARGRQPFCPANGLLVLIPWASLETDDSAKEAGAVLHRDLATARAAMKLRCPAVAAVGDLETARGFREFCGGFPGDQRQRRLGQRLPLIPDVPAAELPALFELGANWIGQKQFPTWIYKGLKLDGVTRPGGAANRNLYWLLREAHARFPRLGRLFRHGLPVPAEDFNGPSLFGGCYLAGTGSHAEAQAFVAGLFQRLADGQSYVSWTDEALAEDNRYRRRATAGYALIIAAAVALGAFVWLLITKK